MDPVVRIVIVICRFGLTLNVESLEDHTEEGNQLRKKS